MKKGLFFVLFIGIAGFVAFQVLVYIDNNAQWGRMRETPAVRPHEQEMLLMEEGTVPFQGGEAVFRAHGGEDLVSPVRHDDPRIVRTGERLYFTYCAQCHGKYHDGNGTVGQSFHPLPGDLRAVKVQNMTDGLIFKEISYGLPEGRQPPLATTVDVMDRWRIIAYIKSLGPR